MPTNFPSSVDALTNPVAGDGLNSPSHSGQHANANDAIEAIESYLLTGAGAPQLVKIIPSSASNGTVGADGTVSITSSVSSVTVNGAFSSTYDNYKILISGQANITQDLRFALGGIAGTGYTSVSGFYYPSSGALNGFYSSGQAFWTLGNTGNRLMNFEIDLFGVNSNQAKIGVCNFQAYHVNAGDENGGAGSTQLWSTSTATATAFTVTIPAGSITAGTTIRVFGIRK